MWTTVPGVVLENQQISSEIVRLKGSHTPRPIFTPSCRVVVADYLETVRKVLTSKAMMCGLKGPHTRKACVCPCITSCKPFQREEDKSIDKNEDYFQNCVRLISKC